MKTARYLALIGIVAGGCRSPKALVCASDSACFFDGVQGACRRAPDGQSHCALPDDTCPFRLRWHRSAGGTAVNACLSCESACSPNHVASPTCEAGICSGRCDPGWDDCNNDKGTDGCETNVESDPDNCGGCKPKGYACSRNNITKRTCAAGKCTGECDQGWNDCNGDKVKDGCEADLNNSAVHCGKCNVECSRTNCTPMCMNGICGGICVAGHADCNKGRANDGCEQDVFTDAAHCGDCDKVCSNNHVAAPTCVMGKCSGDCDKGFADCNADKQTDGCEVDTRTDNNNCGACKMVCGMGERCTGSACRSANGTPCTQGGTCLSGTCTAGLCANALNFVPAPMSPFPVGMNPQSITVADFDGDGKLDLAVANNGSNNVSVLRGNGNGSFQAPTNYAAGVEPTSVAAGDLNGDNKSDLVVANYGSANVSVLLNKGNGTFGAANNFSAGSGCQSVAMADLDADGKADLAVANYSSNNVSLLFGTGAGTFQPAVTLAVGTNPRSVGVGDFDGDGKEDLAVANYGGNNASLLFGSGNRTFQPASNLAVGTNPIAIAVADWNRDGTVDLAVVNYWSENVTVALGRKANRNLQAVMASPMSSGGPVAAAVGDFNQDGRADLAVSNNNSNKVGFLLGKGDGIFLPAIEYSVSFGSNPQSVAAGDLNGDGNDDTALPGFSSGNVSVLLNASQ